MLNADHDTAFTPIGSRQEKIFLEGPNSRWKELMFVVDVLKEFVSAFRRLHFIGPCVTFFGSARFNPDHPYYIMARDMAKAVAGLGFTVITGGGPGIMEAANRGARDAGGKSVGCNIVLPVEQQHNPYLDYWVTVDYFFIRKVLLTKYSYGFIVMPGGYGTLDEFFEAITLIQTCKVKRFPVVLMGVSYHQELFEHIQRMVQEHTISEEDSKLFLFTDSIEDAVLHLTANIVRDVAAGKGKRRMRPLAILGEMRNLWSNKQQQNMQLK